MSRIKMQNVRICFPSLFSTASFGGEDTGKYAATFILDKKEHAEIVNEIKAAMNKLAKEKFKGKLPPADKLCIKDGDDTERPEFEVAFTVKASTKKRPLVLDRDKRPLTEDDGTIYAGCYVNAIITLWAQDNSYGKRINAQLDGIQFCNNGEPLGAGGIDVDEFDAFSSEDEELSF